ncbi:uncharacterized protein DNG_02355 [Cephalotrichum gorgonifer]|uniref:Transmembrane protein n=1 Tax=Cephalotrichum gorgonifer TaxID=2041049 RepID=A0AAE8ST67_9PEZI|nr:uncharacterized protein DNG_02355 [Cephalotrichum gorgonifer]
MRLPSIGGMWPGRAAPSGRGPEQPSMSEAPRAHSDPQPRERIRSRPHSTFGLQVAALVGRDRARSRDADNGVVGDEVQSPKTPEFQLGMPSLPSTRLQLPYLTRPMTTESAAPSPRPLTSSAEQPRSVPVPAEPLPTFTISDHSGSETSEETSGPWRVAATDARHGGSRSSSPSTETLGSERRILAPEEIYVRGAIVAGEGAVVGREDEQAQKRFLCCLPWIRSRRVRSQIVRCLVSGVVLIFLLAMYLALSLSKSLQNGEFTVLLILLILFTTIIFCHGLIRLCMSVMRPGRDDDDTSSRGPGLSAFVGFSLPRRPVRVLLARDEEAAGIESETTKLQPPAYGLWRESVRVDPNRLFWQRNQDAAPDEPSTSTETQSIHRPPSYASEDGVGYVVDAVPRSIAPTTDVPLPIHPSERGRLPNGVAAPW